MAESQQAYLNELLGFLHDQNPAVRRIAAREVLPYTAGGHPARAAFLRRSTGLAQAPDAGRPLRDLKALCEDPEMTAHDAFSALINLTDSEATSREVADPDFLQFLLGTICNPTAILADLASMLLSNLTKADAVSSACLCMSASTLPPSVRERLGLGSAAGSGGGSAMDALVEVFARGEGKKLNGHANYDFLASVFANLSALPAGRDYLLGSAPYSKPPEAAPIAQIKVFTEHPNPIRRGGVVSALKNCCFAKEAHPALLSPSLINALPYLLLPLCGPDPFDPDEEDAMPEEVQMLGDDKKREPDAAIREMEVEALLLLATTFEGRRVMRQKRVYRIVQVLHKQEPVDKIRELVERLVNLLERPEGGGTRIEEVASAQAPDPATTNGVPQKEAVPSVGAEEEDDEELMLHEV